MFCRKCITKSRSVSKSKPLSADESYQRPTLTSRTNALRWRVVPTPYCEVTTARSWRVHVYAFISRCRSSVLLHANQWFNFTYLRSHAFRYNTKPPSVTYETAFRYNTTPPLPKYQFAETQTHKSRSNICRGFLHLFHYWDTTRIL